jgi:hypothetical protein
MARGVTSAPAQYRAHMDKYEAERKAKNYPWKR